MSPEANIDLRQTSGLNEEEAKSKLKRNGFNELPVQQNKNPLILFLGVAREPMLILLLAAGSIYFLLGEFKDGFMLLSFVFVVAGIVFYQENRTERTLETLRNLSSPRALVIRGGKQIRVPGREVVCEDVIVLREGDRIPADAVILFSSNLSIDESLLTGESLAVRKAEWDGSRALCRPGGEDLPFVFSGTLVVQGHAIAKVISTGANTEIGKIGKALQTIEEEKTPLQKETGKIVRGFAAAGMGICLLAVLMYGLMRGNWLEGFLAGLTLSMAILPEEFPVVLIIFMTMGAWRISKIRVLTRKAPAIEALGAASVLCVDKTGTLTTNSMRLAMLYCAGQFADISNSAADPSEDFHPLVEYGILASQADPFDPIESELKRIGEKFLANTEHIHDNWKLVKEYNLSKRLLALSHVWESPDRQNYIIAAKGAPEAIADLCHFDAGQIQMLEAKIAAMAERGLRVLGVAKAAFIETELPPQQHDFHFEFIGLLGFIDPVRPAVPASVKEAYSAGMRIIMITGDSPATAQFVAQTIGIKNPSNCITGAELDKMPPERLKERIREVNVFARVVPEQKLAIVEALKANGEIVAMTGDGVNDAPALKSAHIGIAMGERGTDVAREAADMVLLDDDFSSIVTAVKQGRRIFENLKKAIAYIFSVHIPIAGMALLPVIFHLPIVLLPAHIAFLELVIDPACSMVFEAEPADEDIMLRPPRRINEALFCRRAFIISFFQGLGVLAVVFLLFWLALFFCRSGEQARTIAFSTLVFANIMLILTNLSWSKTLLGVLFTRNRALWWVLCGTISALMLALYAPFFNDLLHFSRLSLMEVLFCFLAGLISVLWFEGMKYFGKKSG